MPRRLFPLLLFFACHFTIFNVFLFNLTCRFVLEVVGRMRNAVTPQPCCLRWRVQGGDGAASTTDRDSVSSFSGSTDVCLDAKYRKGEMFNLFPLKKDTPELVFRSFSFEALRTSTASNNVARRAPVASTSVCVCIFSLANVPPPRSPPSCHLSMSSLMSCGLKTERPHLP